MESLLKIKMSYYNMVKADKHGQTDHIMKVIGKMAYSMAKENTMMQMVEHYIMEIGNKERDLVLASSYGVITVLMLANGNLMCNMDQEISK